ncbi:MAG: hypothetical protein AWM53_00189 [Candidatus Dichloromethanomonas elyunquensis]|nr:MAG: hypothetical protein AWM53_00189 [Candidatus Dichloromethanomonas elyunquensis]
MNNDKAYLLGLIIGGGIINPTKSNLIIVLPYKRWGKVISNPIRAGKIASDILLKVKPVFENEYDISVTFNPEPEWSIVCTGNLEKLTDDLHKFGIVNGGELRKNAGIENLIPYLCDENLKRQFIAGLADSIGSVVNSHRRFNDDYQIISFEFSGDNFRLVFEICQLLNEIKCFADQILWNHPNQHSGNDRYYGHYYGTWKKGFKIRVLLDQYTKKGSFVFNAKLEAAKENIEKEKTEEHEANSCLDRRINVNGIKPVHIDEDNFWIPKNLRGYHFVHHKHLCAMFGCPYVPKNQLKPILDNLECYITPFTVITKARVDQINKILESEEVLKNRTYTKYEVKVEKLIEIYKRDPNTLIWGNSKDKSGYPVNKVLQALAAVLSMESRTSRGKRTSGNFIRSIEDAISNDTIKHINIYMPDKLTPIKILGTNFGALVGPENPGVYKKLIEKDSEFGYKVRAIREEDFE